jgi:hypothetical protein
MTTPLALLKRCQELGITLALWPDGSIKVSPPGVLPEPLRLEIRNHRAEILPLLTRQQEPLMPNLPPAIAEVFPDWQGILVKSAFLKLSVWVVRNRPDGEALAKDTGHPALLLEDVLALTGKNPEEVRRTLLPLLICPTA